MVEGARLESVYMGNCIAGSNPALSAFARRSFAAYALKLWLLQSAGGLSYVGYGGQSPLSIKTF